MRATASEARGERPWDDHGAAHERGGPRASGDQTRARLMIYFRRHEIRGGLLTKSLSTRSVCVSHQRAVDEESCLSLAGQRDASLAKSTLQRPRVEEKEKARQKGSRVLCVVLRRLGRLPR